MTHSEHGRPLHRTVGGTCAALVLMLCVLMLGATAPAHAAQGARTPAATSSTPPRIFAYYYLWWSTQHWHDRLGPNYPYTASPLPLPATTDADGCSPVSRYGGNSLTDVPATLRSQDVPGAIEADVRAAAAARLAGFVVNWIGTGSRTQTSSDTGYSRRLAALVAAVHTVNREGTPFSLIFSLKASAGLLSAAHLTNDVDFLARSYGVDTAVDRSLSPRRLPVVWNGSRKYPAATLAAVSSAVRSRVLLLGDETAASWTPQRATALDGDDYYWSSQDPVGNPASFAQLAALAAEVRAAPPNPDGTRKVFLAPLTPGYSPRLLTGSSTCVPRRSGQTLRDVYAGNARSAPDAFTLISWNEIAEGSYIAPMQRYGSLYTTTVARIVTGTG